MEFVVTFFFAKDQEKGVLNTEMSVLGSMLNEGEGDACQNLEYIIRTSPGWYKFHMPSVTCIQLPIFLLTHNYFICTLLIFHIHITSRAIFWYVYLGKS